MSMKEAVESKVHGIGIHVPTNSPVLILTPKDSDELRMLIWIGHFEASAIAGAQAGLVGKRPMPLDLICDMIARLEGRVTRVVITELRQSTFYAKIYIAQGDKVFEIDARPSDAVAVALKMKVPLFANPDLFTEDGVQPPGPQSPEELRESLRNIRPEDFGSGM